MAQVMPHIPEGISCRTEVSFEKPPHGEELRPLLIHLPHPALGFSLKGTGGRAQGMQGIEKSGTQDPRLPCDAYNVHLTHGDTRCPEAVLNGIDRNTALMFRPCKPLLFSGRHHPPIDHNGGSSIVHVVDPEDDQGIPLLKAIHHNRDIIRIPVGDGQVGPTIPVEIAYHHSREPATSDEIAAEIETAIPTAHKNRHSVAQFVGHGQILMSIVIKIADGHN
jgi:hypothetical protein